MSQPLNKTCGLCQHFMRYVQEDNGQCYLNPPTIFATGASLRPNVKVTTRACGGFAPLPEGVPAEVKVKATVPTHGQVVKKK